jgi:hypothetical protein
VKFSVFLKKTNFPGGPFRVFTWLWWFGEARGTTVAAAPTLHNTIHPGASLLLCPSWFCPSHHLRAGFLCHSHIFTLIGTAKNCRL